MGIIRVHTLQVMRIARLVLRLEPRNPTRVESPEEAFADRSIDPVVHENIQSHLTKHYAGRDLLTLIPRFELKRWLKKQRDKETKLGWITDLLNQPDEDEADWWKRGNDAPY